MRFNTGGYITYVFLELIERMSYTRIIHLIKVAMIRPMLCLLFLPLNHNLENIL